MYQVEKRVEYTVITAATVVHNADLGTRRFNVQAAISMAFVLGARFGMAHPTISADYMQEWLKEYTDDAHTAGIRHHMALANSIFPVTHYEDDLEGKKGT